MSQTEHSCRYTPRQPQERAESRHQAYDQHVKVVATAFLQLVLLPVHDDGGDLLVHEQQDGEEEGGDGGEDVDIPGGSVIKQRNEPAASIRSRWLKMQQNASLY